MRDTQTALFAHLVWATWDRLPLLVGERERRVYRCFEKTCRELGVEILALGGVEDHVHLVVRLPATLAVAELVKRLKGASSHLATHDIARERFFKWQGGYGAFSVGAPGLPALCAYVRGQKDHHRLGTLVAILRTGRILMRDAHYTTQFLVRLGRTLRPQAIQARL